MLRRPVTRGALRRHQRRIRAWPFRACHLGVLVLDPATFAAAAAHAALPPPTPAGVAALALLVGADADAEEQVCQEEGGPGAPHEAEGVGADPGTTVV